jgi:hypothetical protein
MKKGLLIPEIKARKAIRERIIMWQFRNAWIYAMDGGLTFRDKDIHGRKDPHECGGTLPACLDVCWGWYIKGAGWG